MATFPGKSDLRAAAYQRVYTTFTATINLTTEVHQAPNAASGALVINATAGALAFSWTDCSGTQSTVSVPANTVLDFPFALASIHSDTADTLSAVVVYWHPSVR